MADEQSPAKPPVRKHGFLALEGRLRPSAQAPKPVVPPAPQVPTEATPEIATPSAPQEPTEQPETPLQMSASPSYRPVALEAQATHANAGAATLMGSVAPASDPPANSASSIPDVTFGPCRTEAPPPSPQPETFAVPRSTVRENMRDEARVIVRDENKLTQDEIDLYVSKGAQFSKVEDAAEREAAFAETLDHLIKLELDNGIAINNRARCWYEARHLAPALASSSPKTDARDEEITSARTTPRRSHIPADVPFHADASPTIEVHPVEDDQPETQERFPALAAPKSAAANAATDKATDKETAPKHKGKSHTWFIGTCFGVVAAVVIVIGVQCARHPSNAKAAGSTASATAPGQLMTACEAVTPGLLREYFGQDDPTDFKQGVATAFRDSRVKQHEKIRDINCGPRVQITDNKIDVSECCVEP
ncbi:MAG: hypothetical protein WA001_00560 [Patescibacteria group bacterium]